MAQQGEYLGMYRLLNLVGNGRHCQVWEAMHDGRNERYALKVINSNYRNDGEQLSLMKHEFAVGKELSHPNVITIFEFDSSKLSPGPLALLGFPVVSTGGWAGGQGKAGKLARTG